MGKGLILGAALLLAGCAERVVYVSDGCLWAKPIRPTQAEIDAMTQETAAQILAYNEKGAAVCGWAP